MKTETASQRLSYHILFIQLRFKVMALIIT